MKAIVFLVCFPFLAATQTIHFKGKQILYEGTVVQPAASVFTHFQPAITTALEKGVVATSVIPEQQLVTAKGVLALNLPFPSIRRVHFNLSLSATANGYTYRIDSVYLTESEHGSETTKLTTAEELLEGREQTGTAAAENEKILNEIDMRFQKLLALIRRAMKEKG